MLAFANDLIFDPFYSLKTRARLDGCLSVPFVEWVIATYPKLAEHLAMQLDQKSTVAVHVARTGLKVKGCHVWCMFLLIVGPEAPWQCVLFIGGEGWIQARKADVQAQLNEQLRAPGIRATIVASNPIA